MSDIFVEEARILHSPNQMIPVNDMPGRSIAPVHCFYQRLSKNSIATRLALTSVLPIPPIFARNSVVVVVVWKWRKKEGVHAKVHI